MSQRTTSMPTQSSHPRPLFLVGVGAALLVLWAASFGLSYVPLGGAALPVALAIAAAKAGLVLLFFMELVREPATIRLAFATGVVLLAVLIGLAVADVGTRDRAPLVVPGATGHGR